MTVNLITLFNFDATNDYPYRNLIADQYGDLFGSSDGGGTNGLGTVFEIVNNGSPAAPSYASTPTTLVSFNLFNGWMPEVSLIDANGDLFGTTTEGGAYGNGTNGLGTVFEIVNNGTPTAPSYASSPTTLVSFNLTDGAYPYGGLIADDHGDLFGTTGNGGANGLGTVFEIVNNGTPTAPGYASSPTTLVSFDGTNGEGADSLIADQHGNLFGATSGGGASDYGTVFEIAKTATGYASTPTTLVNFNFTNGGYPLISLIDAHGDLFGTTNVGGVYGDGTVFEIVNNGSPAAPSYASTPTTLAGFNGANGDDPTSGVIADARGDLFGTTYDGGANSLGTVFEIAKTATGYASTPITLASFNGTNGGYPNGGLIADDHGDLFGTTGNGGANGLANGFGTLFEITGSGFVPLAITGTVVNQLVNDNATIDPFANVAIADVTVGQTETVTVAPSDAAIGTLSDPNAASDGSTITNGIYTVTGTAAAVTADLDDLVFTPTNHQVAPGSIETTGFTIAVTDTAGQTATDSTTSVVVYSSSSTLYEGVPGGTVSLGNGPSVFDGSAGNETLIAGNGPDVIIAGPNDNIRAGNGNDAVLAGSNDTITLGNGSDVVNAGDSDTINLGNGADTVTAGANSTITVGNGAGDVVSASNSSYDVITLGNGAGDSVNANNSSYDIITLGNGAGDSVTTSDGVSDTITLGNGAGDTVATSDGVSDTITLGNGAGDTVATGLPGAIDSTIILGNGINDTVNAIYCVDDTITLGNGAGDVVDYGRGRGGNITLGNGAGDSVEAGQGEHNIITLGNGAGDSVSVALEPDTITLGNGNADVVHVAEGVGNTIKVGNGNADVVNVVDGGIDNTITVGNGAGDMVNVDKGDTNSITLGNGSGDVVNAGCGYDTISLGNGNGDVVNDFSIQGNNTITVGNGNDTVFGGLNDIITAGNGQNQLVAAPGDVWTVGKGQDVFQFNAGFGNNTITDFNTSRDVLQFNQLSLLTNYAAAMADTKQVGLDTVITYDANDSVTLTGVTASHLTASNFKFT